MYKDDWWEKNSTDATPEFEEGKTMICTDDGITWIEFDSSEILIWFANDFPTYVLNFSLVLIFGVIPALALWAFLDYRDKQKCQSIATQADQGQEKATP